MKRYVRDITEDEVEQNIKITQETARLGVHHESN